MFFNHAPAMCDYDHQPARRVSVGFPSTLKPTRYIAASSNPLSLDLTKQSEISFRYIEASRGFWRVQRWDTELLAGPLLCDHGIHAVV